ncbi:uncharacterized protein AB675_5838 [Cyphellophora attinorum]|uniref:Uncharacterized protein n=1 Tax=Cyphellophora attinorum TaxID=1664694 RepID=A0A0N1HS32_9EURO|nr:uncharacterized protein AB675_5838 [Phialophora attinorum]KPI38816.1 hypothetical protein AB675_5838 [Phialophora attinorum]
MRSSSTLLAMAALASAALAQGPPGAASWQDASGTAAPQYTATVTMTLEVVHTVTSYDLPASTAALSNGTISASKSAEVTIIPSVAPTSTSSPSPSSLPATGGAEAGRMAQTAVAIFVAGAAAFFSL